MLAGWVRNRKLVTTPKFPPPPRRAQNRSAFSVSDAVTKLAVGQHHVGLEQIIHGEAILAAEVAVTPAQRQAGNTGGRDDSERHGLTKSAGGVIDVAGDAAGADPHRPLRRVNPYALHHRQIDDQAVIDAAEPGPLWPPPRTAIGSLLSRPKLTAAITSATSAQRAITSGLLLLLPCVGLPPQWTEKRDKIVQGRTAR